MVVLLLMELVVLVATVAATEPTPAAIAAIARIAFVIGTRMIRKPNGCGVYMNGWLVDGCFLFSARDS